MLLGRKEHSVLIFLLGEIVVVTEVIVVAVAVIVQLVQFEVGRQTASPMLFLGVLNLCWVDFMSDC